MLNFVNMVKLVVLLNLVEINSRFGLESYLLGIVFGFKLLDIPLDFC